MLFLTLGDFDDLPGHALQLLALLEQPLLRQAAAHRVHQARHGRPVHRLLLLGEAVSDCLGEIMAKNILLHWVHFHSILHPADTPGMGNYSFSNTNTIAALNKAEASAKTEGKGD